MTIGRHRAVLWACAVVLFAVATFIALRPVESGDNYCGRLYFDRQWNAACRDDLAILAGWFLALAGAAVVIVGGLLVTARRPPSLAAATLGAVAIIGILIGLNRLLQPIAPSVAFCGSVLNPHTFPFDRTYATRCDHLLDPYKRAAVVAFGVAAVCGAGLAVARNQASPASDRPADQRPTS